MDNYHTPNVLAPLHPITPARVNVWPPQASNIANRTMIYEQSYGASSNGGSTNSNSGIDTGQYIVMGIFTALILFVIITMTYGFLQAGFHKKPQVSTSSVINPSTSTNTPTFEN